MAWRRTQPALVEGDIKFIDTNEPVLAFYRKHGNDSMLCVFNLASEPATLTVTQQPLHPFNNELSHHNAQLHGDTLKLPGYGCWFARV
jgi:alpha-glucosidase